MLVRTHALQALAALAVAMVALTPTDAFSGVLECDFQMECVETEECVATDYALTITYTLKPLGPNGMISRAERSDVSGRSTGLIAVRDHFMRFTTGSFFEGSEEQLTITPSYEARYIVTMTEVPMIISYFGRCEVIE